VNMGDLPGVNLVIKQPKPNEETGKIDFESAIHETHFIEFLYDWYLYQAFIVRPREELIIRDQFTK